MLGSRLFKQPVQIGQELRIGPVAAGSRFVESLMQRVTVPGKIAGWIAPPDRGINAQPVEYEYVKL